MNCERIDEFGEFDGPFRTIRFALDHTGLYLDLVPCVYGDSGVAAPPGATEGLRALLGGAREILETDQYLRLTFEDVAAVAAQDDLGEPLLDQAQAGWELMPRTQQAELCPLVEVQDSPWRSKVPEFRGSASGGLHHVRAIGIDLSVEVLGSWPQGRWLSF